MDLPTVVWRLVGQYAVASLADLELLSRAGLRDVLDHPLALAHVPLEFRTDQELFTHVSSSVLGGVRLLTLESVSDQGLVRLAASAPKLEQLNLDGCANLRQLVSLARFPSLRTLRMSKCTACTMFFGTLEELDIEQCLDIEGDLRNLTRLKLHRCVVNNITSMNPNLTSLDLRDTSWVDRTTVWGYEGGWTPHRLSELTSLRELSLAECGFATNEFASSIGHLKGLRTLAIRGCPDLTDFAFIAALPDLQDLCVHVTHQFDWTVIQSAPLRALTLLCRNLDQLLLLKPQKGLQMLRLRWHFAWGLPAVNPSVQLSEVLPCLTKLHTLVLSEWGEIQNLPVCPSVQSLAVDFCHLQDEGLAALMVSFPNLHTLSVAFVNITDAGLGFLPQTLQHLRICGCKVARDGILHLDQLRQLRSVDITSCDIKRMKLPKTIQLLGVGSKYSLDETQLLALRRRRVKIVSTEQFQKTLPMFANYL